MIAIDQNKIRRQRQVINGQRHCFQSGPQDIQEVDLLMMDHSDAHPQGLFKDMFVKIVSFFGGNLFGIEEPLTDAVFWKDDRRSHDRPGKRASSCLIHTGNPPKALAIIQLFEEVHGLGWKRWEKHSKTDWNDGMVEYWFFNI